MKGSFLASTLVICAATAMSAYGGFALEAATQSGSTVPVVSSDPAVQHQIEAQLAAPRLDPTAMVAQIEMTGRPWASQGSAGRRGAGRRVYRALCGRHQRS
jgi:hypothetical protein